MGKIKKNEFCFNNIVFAKQYRSYKPFGNKGECLEISLLYAGTGVAMANGQEHIKQAADFITKDCDNFGVAEILEKIIEKGEI